MILPGSESRNAEVSSACHDARYDSTPLASTGSNHRICQAVMIPSRPKQVENQGMPAYGLGPVGIGVVSSARSERDLSIQALNSRPLVVIRAPCRRRSRMANRARAAAARKRVRDGGSVPSSPTST